MKKILLFAFLACVFVSCSSDGSREIQIDEISFIPGLDYIKPNEIEKVSSIFEVVPGKYELTWTKVQELPQMESYNVSLKLKFRLKRTVKFTEKFLEEVKTDDFVSLGTQFDFWLLDANGTIDPQYDVNNFYFGSRGCTNDVKKFDKDEYMDFINFLQSKPGTEKEFELDADGYITSIDGVNCIETCKNAKNIVCKVEVKDKEFESRYGTIVE